MNSLVFPSDSLSRLRKSLLAQAPNEAAAVILAGSSSSGTSSKLLVRELFEVPTAS